MCALFRIYNLTKVKADGAMVTQEHLLLIMETLLAELEADSENEAEESSMSPSTLAELYMTSFVLQTAEEFKHDLDFEPLNTIIQ